MIRFATNATTCAGCVSVSAMPAYRLFLPCRRVEFAVRACHSNMQENTSLVLSRWRLGRDEDLSTDGSRETVAEGTSHTPDTRRVLSDERAVGMRNHGSVTQSLHTTDLRAAK